MLSMYEIKRILQTEHDDNPIDDFRIIDSWTEYESDNERDPANRRLAFLCYEIEVMDPNSGERTRCYKAIRFARVLRLPGDAKQSLAFMDMQQQVLSSVWENGYNYITIIANIIKPEPIGLLFLYGIQGVSTSLEKAKEIAHRNFIGYVSMMQGTFRVLEMECLKAKEAEWLREKMYNMKHMTVIRGIPKANRSGENAGNKGMGDANLNPNSQGTLEELITGMADYEYVVEILSTPVRTNTLMGWQRTSQKEMTDWYGQLQGTKGLSFNLSIPMMYMANVSNSQGWNKSYTDSNTVSYSQGENYSQGQSQNVGQSFSQNYGLTVGQTHGRSSSMSLSNGVTHSRGLTFGETIGENMGVNQSVSHGTSRGLSMNQSIGHSQNAGISQNQSHGLSQGMSLTDTQGHTTGTSYGLSQGHTEGSSHTLGNSHSMGLNQSHSASIGNTATVSQTASKSNSLSYNEGFSSGKNHGYSHGNSLSENYSYPKNYSVTQNSSGGWTLAPVGFGGVNGSNTHGNSSSKGMSSGWSSGDNWSSNDGVSFSHNQSLGRGQTTSIGNTVSNGASVSNSTSIGRNESWGATESYGTTASDSISQNWGANSSDSISQSIGQNVGKSDSYGSGTSASVGNSLSNGYGMNVGENDSMSMGSSYGRSHSQSVSNSESLSQSQTLGQSLGQTVSDSLSRTASNGFGQSISQGQSISNGQSFSSSNGRNQGTSAGTSGTTTTGTSSSMGLGPSIGYSKSYQWLDQGVKDLLELLEFQNERIKKALRGEGAFYTYVYIACPSMDALSAAQAAAKSTWQNMNAMIQPLQVLDLTESEQKHLLYHFAAFSADITRENVFGAEEYKYCTILLPEEFVAYTHLPRVSEGGVAAIIQDVPKFAVPSGLHGEIYLGTVLNPERFTFKNGYRTQFDYRIDESALIHGFFTGASRSGKTVAAMRMIGELAHVRRKKTGKGLRIVVMDPKQDWRGLARYVEPERFKFFSMGNVNFEPIKLNPWKIPYGVWPQIWIDGVIDIYCRAYGLLERGKQMIADVVYELYNEEGVFDACEREDWRIEVPKRSANVTFADIYQRMFDKKAALEDPNNKGGRAGNDTRDAYARLLDRLSCFNRTYGIEYQLYGTREGVGIDDLIGGESEFTGSLKDMGMITVLESKGLENTFKNFIFGVVTSGFYKYALAHEGGFLAEDQNETVLVIEEANEVLIGTDTAGGGDSMSLSGESEFEQILDQSAGYGLFIFSITQKIADMPSSVIANSGLVFSGRLARPDDINTVVRAVGREERIDDRDLVKWFPRAPIGWFVCKSARGFDFKEAEPVLVQIAMLNVSTPSNMELKEILTQKKINALLKSKENVA